MSIKVTFKTITQQSFELELDENVTIGEVKQRIASEKGVKDFPIEGQKLIYNGSVLDDSSTIGGLKIAEKKFIVVMVTKKKEIVESKQVDKPDESVSAKQDTAENVKQSVEGNQASTQQAPTNATSNVEGGGGDISPEHLTVLQGIEAMGYPREEALRALRASFFNADRAVEYLCNGIPDGLQLDDPAAIVGEPADEGEVDEEAGAGEGLAFLQNSPQFQQLRAMVRSNPAMLNQVVQQIAATNPELMNIIQNNQAEFLQLLNTEEGNQETGAQGEHAGVQPQVPGAEAGVRTGRVAIPVTAEDRAALQRLGAMGFPEALCIEAYFACDKNEDLAANYILQRMDEFNQED